MLDVEVYYENGQGGYMRLGETIANGVRAVSARDGNYFHLTLETVAALLAGVGQVTLAQANKRAAVEAAKKVGWAQQVEGIDGRVKKLTELAAGHTEWIKLVREPRERPKPDAELRILPGLLSLWWDCDAGKIRGAKVPLVLVTRPRKEPVVEEGSAPQPTVGAPAPLAAKKEQPDVN